MDEQEKKLDEVTQQEQDGGIRQEAYFTMKSLVGVLAVLVLVFTFVGRLIVVDGASMEPTLLDREMLVVRSIAYTPKQGDIVVLAKDGFHNGDAIVKRVIATGEQHVEIDYGMGEVRVDGVPLDEPYIKEFMIQQYYQTITDIVVPKGSIFVMGDNRNNSDDSRDAALGTVDARLVLGKAVLILFPFNKITVL